MNGRSGQHWRGLDGLRGLSVIAVVVYHFSPASLPGGFLGVDVFFGISGYLITRLLVAEFIVRGRIDAGHFYRRRARRLLPALAVVLGAVSCASLIWRDQLATVRGGVVSSALFVGNWWLAFDHQPYFVSTGRPSMLQHLWSLGVEEQFYLVWPIIAAAVLAAGRRAMFSRDRPLHDVIVRLVQVAITGAIFSTGLMWLIADLHDVPYGSDGSTLYYGSETHCMGLLLGAALGAWSAADLGLPNGRIASAVRRRVDIPAAWRQPLVEIAGFTALIVLGVLTAEVASSSRSLYRGDFLIVGVLVVIVIAVATRPMSVLGGLLDLPVIRWVGLRSYSIYLWHWPIAVVTRPGIDTSMPVWLDQLLRITLTVALADASYRWIETPVRRSGFRVTWTSVADQVRSQWRRVPPAATVAGPVALAVMTVVGAVVIVVGPAAPRPSAAAGAIPGGRNLSLTPGPAISPAVGPPDARKHRGALPKISGFGDSVLLGARKALSTTFPGGSIDAVEGRQPDPILADIRGDAHRGALNPLVVIHIGNNGLIKPSDLQNTLRLLRSARLVLVLNDHLSPDDHSWQKANNDLIDKVVPMFGNARVIDWNALAGAHKDWLYKDDLHLRPAGAAAYARLLAAAYRADVGSTPVAG